MDHQLNHLELPVTEAVVPGSGAVATRRPSSSQARWARVGLLGIGVAAIVAAAALAFGATLRPTGTLAAGRESNGNTGGVTNLRDGRGPGFPGGPGRGFGLGGISITVIAGSSITLQTEDGWTRTVTVDSDTTYAKAGEAITLGELAVGDEVGFRQTLEDDGTWTIDSIVVVLPHVGGEVTAISGSTITVAQRDGTTATINVTGDTSYVVDGDPATLADVEVGMFLVAEGERAGDGTIDALRVRAVDAEGFRGGHGFRFFGDAGKPDATRRPA